MFRKFTGNLKASLNKIGNKAYPIIKMMNEEKIESVITTAINDMYTKNNDNPVFTISADVLKELSACKDKTIGCYQLFLLRSIKIKFPDDELVNATFDFIDNAMEKFDKNSAPTVVECMIGVFKTAENNKVLTVKTREKMIKVMVNRNVFYPTVAADLFLGKKPRLFPGFIKDIQKDSNAYFEDKNDAIRNFANEHLNMSDDDFNEALGIVVETEVEEKLIEEVVAVENSTKNSANNTSISKKVKSVKPKVASGELTPGEKDEKDKEQLNKPKVVNIKGKREQERKTKGNGKKKIEEVKREQQKEQEQLQQKQQQQQKELKQQKNQEKEKPKAAPSTKGEQVKPKPKTDPESKTKPKPTHPVLDSTVIIRNNYLNVETGSTVAERFKTALANSKTYDPSKEGHTHERRAAKQIMQEIIKQNNENFKTAIFLSLAGIIIPIISHIVIWAIYFATRAEAAEVVVDQDRYFVMKKLDGDSFAKQRKDTAVLEEVKSEDKDGETSSRFKAVFVEHKAEGKKPATLSLLFLNRKQAQRCVDEIKEFDQKNSSEIPTLIKVN